MGRRVLVAILLVFPEPGAERPWWRWALLGLAAIFLLLGLASRALYLRREP
jgi:hypothetical protein